MINWNYIQVEQEIAQDRYEVIIRGRQLGRFRQQENRAGHYVRLRNWLGAQLIDWGCQVKVHCQAA